MLAGGKMDKKSNGDCLEAKEVFLALLRAIEKMIWSTCFYRVRGFAGKFQQDHDISDDGNCHELVYFKSIIYDCFS